MYDYDNADQLTSIWHQRVSGATNTISRYQYGYDDAGNRTNMVGTAGSAVRSESYGYDAMDQLTGVTYKTGGVTDRIVNYFFDAAGNRTGMVERVGSATNTTSYVANTDNQLTSTTTTRQGLTVTGLVNPGASSNKWSASTASSRGVSAAVSSTNGTFAIPGVPVTGGANALTVTVTDVSGNIATQVVAVTVATGTTALGYDANGNQTNDAVWSYSYDRENRLTSASSASLAVNYVYDPLDRLIERRTSGSSVSTNRMYYAAWQLIAEYNGSGTLQRKYVYGLGIDEPLRMNAGGTNYYYHADGLGSVTEMIDTQGLIVESYSYDVYGTPAFYNASGTQQPASGIQNRLLFTARDRDPDTGWYNYRYRYYNPTLGRFAQPDPIGILSGDVNLYRYGEDDPIAALDLFGLDDLARTYRLWFFHWTYYGSGYSTLTPEEKMATEVHEDVHRYDPGQQSLNIFGRAAQEIDAYQKEINWTEGQIALILRMKQEESQKECPDEARLNQLRQSLNNYLESLQNAQEELKIYQTTNWRQQYWNKFKNFYHLGEQ